MHKISCNRCQTKLLADNSSVIICPHCQNSIVVGNPNWIHTERASALPMTNPETGTNNIYWRDGCPALMSDGRFITYHYPTNELTNALQKAHNFRSANEFRTFMQKHGDQLMLANRQLVHDQNTCRPSMACSDAWL